MPYRRPKHNEKVANQMQPQALNHGLKVLPLVRTTHHGLLHQRRDTDGKALKGS